MTYDLVKQRHPDAPCIVGAAVVETATGREGRIAPPVAGLGDQVRVRFAGEVLARPVDPDALAYAGALAPITLHQEGPCPSR